METKLPAPTRTTDLWLGLIGAAAGGALGYLIFSWIAGLGFIALALPGALMGLGFGFFAKQRTVAPAVFCGVAAIGLGIFIEWRCFPFIKDDSFGYFLMHLHNLSPITLVMILFGGFCGFWFALGWKGRV